MTYLRGENIHLGVGIESPAARGTFVAPQVFVPGRSPASMNVDLVKLLMKETRGSGVKSQGSEIIQRKASGKLPFNLRSESFGYFLLSLLGKATTTTVSGSVMKHVFEIPTPVNPQNPSLSLVLAQDGHQHYKYKGSIARALELKVQPDDLVNAEIDVLSMDEEEVANQTVAYSNTDYFFRPFDVSIKIASDVAGLAGATALTSKEFSFNYNNGGKAQQTIGSVTPTDNITEPAEIGGGLVLDYIDKSFHDLFKAGTYRAMQIKMERPDITYSGSYHPYVTILLPKISFEASTPDRPLEDIVRDNLKFVAHHSEADSKAISIEIQNTVAGYAAV